MIMKEGKTMRIDYIIDKIIEEIEVANIEEYKTHRIINKI